VGDTGINTKSPGFQPMAHSERVKTAPEAFELRFKVESPPAYTIMAFLEPLIQMSHPFLLHAKAQSQVPQWGEQAAALPCLLLGPSTGPRCGAASPPADAFCTAESAVFLFPILRPHSSLGSCPYQSKPLLMLELG